MVPARSWNPFLAGSLPMRSRKRSVAGEFSSSSSSVRPSGEVSRMTSRSARRTWRIRASFQGWGSPSWRSCASRCQRVAPKTSPHGAIVVALTELADLAAELFEMPAGLAAADAAAAEAQRPGRAHRVLEIHRGAGIGIPQLLEQRDARSDGTRGWRTGSSRGRWTALMWRDRSPHASGSEPSTLAGTRGGARRHVDERADGRVSQASPAPRLRHDSALGAAGRVDRVTCAPRSSPGATLP